MQIYKIFLETLSKLHGLHLGLGPSSLSLPPLALAVLMPARNVC